MNGILAGRKNASRELRLKRQGDRPGQSEEVLAGKLRLSDK